ncbi:heparinase II/III family protein [Microbacterium sp. HD4P20]|uniref:heparinase II/III family protein n=1 Tax=Microbacterium sp. HD4P20 TaxID=2864874 RepID=UPI0020A2588E|nr:heparinase II/III family protein [Microbacterium sp. HD4P20]MCP2636275.1 heparinase II/III family protein [Microbacterium sp. HD4P20]
MQERLSHRLSGRRRAQAVVAAAITLALALTGVSPVPAAASAVASDVSDLGQLLDLTRPELAGVAAELAAGDDVGAAEALKEYYATRTGVEYPSPAGGGGDATADELAAGIFRFGDETRDFYNASEQRIDVDWADLWGGTDEIPGSAQTLMSDLTFMPKLASAYLQESDPDKRAAYAAAWMDISLDFVADNQSWPKTRNLAAAKRLGQLVSSFSVFRVEPSIAASDLVAYLSAVHATSDFLASVLQTHVGNNWYVSMARSMYAAGVYLPEFKGALGWETFAARAVERFLRVFLQGDGVYREPTFNYQAYVADLINYMIRIADANGRELPPTLIQAADWIADVLFATRQPDLNAALIGDTPNVDAGASTIRAAGARNAWSDFTWVASGRTQGTTPTLGSTLYPISFAVQRSGWDADARYLLINNHNSSYTASHRHPDDLSIVMAAYGRPLIVDPGAADYSATPTNDWMRRTTEAHNTIEVDREPQAAGVTRAMSLWRSNAGLDIYRGQAMGYQPVAHDRVVYFVKPGFWVVSDDLTGDTAAHDYRQLWHFPGDPVVVDPATKVATVGFDSVAGAAPVSGVQIVPVPASDLDVSPSVHDNGAVRVGEDILTDVEYLSYDWSDTGSTGLDTVLFPGPAGAAPSVTATRIALPGVEHSVATALEIALPDGTGRFYLSREQTPSSREFGAATTDAETAYLERAGNGALTRYALTRGTSLVDDGQIVVDASGVVSDVSVELHGTAASVSLGDSFTGTLTFAAPAAELVTVNNMPTAFTRAGDLVTVTLEPTFATMPVLDEHFDDATLDRAVYGFENGLEGWVPLQGTWELGGEPSNGHLAQTATADTEALAVQQDVPNDVSMSADIVPWPADQSAGRTGLAFRYQSPLNHYRADVVPTATGSKLRLVKVYNGTTTLLKEADLPLAAGAPYTLTVSAVGRHVSAAVGDVSVSANDTQLPNGGAALSANGRAAIFDNVSISEALDQSNWRGIGGEVSVGNGRLTLSPVDGRAHVLAASTLPERFSEACDFVVETELTLSGIGTAGVSLRDTTDAYGYRIHVGRTSQGSQYASIIREAHRSGPVTVATTSLSDRLTGPVRLGAAVHGDLVTVTLNGEQILEGRDTVVRSGGVGLYASTDAEFENLTVARSCGSEPIAAVPPPPHWDAATVYQEGDLVTHGGSSWFASWRTQNQEPGDPYGPWQEIAISADGTDLWRPSRIFVAGDVVENEGHRYEAKWWTRNQAPGDPNGPWEQIE